MPVASTGDPYIYGDTIHEVFRHHADRQPEAPALLYAGQIITYGDLQAAAQALAARFAASGLSPGCFVLVKMRRSPAFAAALLAVLRLGGAYLAVEQSWPCQYVQNLVDRAGAWVVTDEPDTNLTSNQGTLAVAADELPHDRSAQVPHTPVSRHDPCTIFQTSGSTGSPKLAVVPHRATVRAFIGADYADFGPGRVIMQTSPVCWDGLTMELWSVLLSGGTSLIPPQGVPVSGDLLRLCSADYGLDTVWLTSSLFSAIVDDDIGAFANIRQVMSGGERVSADHVRRLRSAYPGIRFSSGYGPVETTVFATSHAIADGDIERYGEVPLGRPLPATTVVLIDEAGEICPPGATGEIYIGGDALGLGYLGDSAETAQRFVTVGSGRFYRTGDLGQWHDAGALLFRGRVDRQVKIRGQRVEPEGLELFISAALPGVVAAVTPWSDINGQVIGLVAHCGTGGREITIADISRACEAGLPPHLRPRRILLHSELPRTENGKVNYSALAEVDAAGVAVAVTPAEADRPGSDSVQSDIAKIAGGILGVHVSPADDLFELGGDSLFAMRLAVRLRNETGIQVTVGHIHRERTAARLAQVAVAEVHEVRPGRAWALSAGEQDLCLHEEIFPGDQALLLPSAYELSGDIDLNDLRNALILTCTRHPALSSVRIMESGGVRANELTADEIRGKLRVQVDDRALTADSDGAVRFPADWLTPFDLGNDLPLRAFAATGPDGGRLLCLVIHHVAMDGWSEHIFTAELARAYADVSAPASAPNWLPARSARSGGVLQIYSEAERERARTYWSALLDGLRPLPITQAFSDGDVLGQMRGRLTREQCRALAQLPGGTGDLHSGALAWYADGLKHAFSRDEFAIGSAYAARDLTDEDTIGYHVQMIPLRIRYPEGKAFSALAADISAQWLASLDQRSISLREIAARSPGTRLRGHRPVFQAGFALQPGSAASLSLAGRTQTRLNVRPPAPPFELYLELWPEARGGATVILQWNVDSISDTVPERLAKRLRATSKTFR
jgi:amino acid adenylation domain-containing protein